MNKTKILFSFVIAVCMSSILSSCKKDDPYVVISAVTSCSPELLDFVIPTVTITGDNGQSQSYELTSSDFKESDKGGSIEIDITVNGLTSSTSSTVMNYIAKSEKRFDCETVSGNIVVTYALKDNWSLDSEKYVFYHGIGYDYRAVSEDGISVTVEGDYIKPIAHEISKENVNKYLNELVSSMDKISFKVTVPSVVR